MRTDVKSEKWSLIPRWARLLAHISSSSARKFLHHEIPIPASVVASDEKASTRFSEIKAKSLCSLCVLHQRKMLPGVSHSVKLRLWMGYWEKKCRRRKKKVFYCQWNSSVKISLFFIINDSFFQSLSFLLSLKKATVYPFEVNSGYGYGDHFVVITTWMLVAISNQLALKLFHLTLSSTLTPCRTDLTAAKLPCSQVSTHPII